MNERTRDLPCTHPSKPSGGAALAPVTATFLPRGGDACLAATGHARDFSTGMSHTAQAFVRAVEPRSETNLVACAQCVHTHIREHIYKTS